jgi:hypothetical protein
VELPMNQVKQALRAPERGERRGFELPSPTI